MPIKVTKQPSITDKPVRLVDVAKELSNERDNAFPESLVMENPYPSVGINSKSKEFQEVTNALEELSLKPVANAVASSQPTFEEINEKNGTLLSLLKELILAYAQNGEYSKVARYSEFASRVAFRNTDDEVEETTSKYKTPVTMTTVLRERDPTLLRPDIYDTKVLTDEEVSAAQLGAGTWITNFFNLIQRQNEARKKLASEKKKKKAKTKPKITAKKTSRK